MRSLVLIAAILTVGASALLSDVRPAAASMSYECETDKDGHPYKVVSISKDINSDVSFKSVAKLSKIGVHKIYNK